MPLTLGLGVPPITLITPITPITTPNTMITPITLITLITPITTITPIITITPAITPITTLGRTVLGRALGMLWADPGQASRPWACPHLGWAAGSSTA